MIMCCASYNSLLASQLRIHCPAVVSVQSVISEKCAYFPPSSDVETPGLMFEDRSTPAVFSSQLILTRDVRDVGATEE